MNDKTVTTKNLTLGEAWDQLPWLCPYMTITTLLALVYIVEMINV